MKIFDLDLDLTFEITRDFGLNFDHECRGRREGASGRTGTSTVGSVN